jgi:hypothetical protein
MKDHFAIPARVITIDINTEDDHTVPAAAFVESSTLMTGSYVEAD